MGLKDIDIKFIPHNEQRYNTLGDYYESKHALHFRITQFPDHPEYSYAILFHELLEKFRNDQLGIKDADVDKFDIDHPELDDPGWSKDAPYFKTHCEGDLIERLFIVLSGANWVDYEAKVMNIPYKEND